MPFGGIRDRPSHDEKAAKLMKRITKFAAIAFIHRQHGQRSARLLVRAVKS
jgi:hypothetical protein